jgi:hypothetical protein
MDPASHTPRSPPDRVAIHLDYNAVLRPVSFVLPIEMMEVHGMAM